MFLWTCADFSGTPHQSTTYCQRGQPLPQGGRPTNVLLSRRKCRVRQARQHLRIFGCTQGAGPEQRPPRTDATGKTVESNNASASEPDELAETRHIDELFNELMRQDLEKRYGKAVAAQWGALPPDAKINWDNPRFREFIEQLVENENTVFSEDPAFDEPDWEHDREIAAFLADNAEKLGLDGPLKDPADLLPPRSTLRDALQHYRQSLGHAPGRDPTFRRADWPPQVLTFESPRRAHKFWHGWCCRYDMERGALIEKNLLKEVSSATLIPEDSALIPLELPPLNQQEQRDPRYDWNMPFGTVVFPDGSYTGGVPAVHSETALGRHHVPVAHAPFELTFGCVITPSFAAESGCQSGLLDVAVEYRDRQASTLRVRWLMPGPMTVPVLAEEALAAYDDFSARMLPETSPSVQWTDRNGVGPLGRVRFPPEEPAFCIFPLYPQMSCCWHASQLVWEPVSSRPLSAETLSRYEVDLDRTEFDDPDIIGTQVRLLRIPRTAQMKGRKDRLGHSIRALLAREATRVAPCTHLLRRSIARYMTVDGALSMPGGRVWMVPNVEEGFVPRRLVHLPGGLVCLFPDRIPRVGFGWDAELWFWGPAFEARLEARDDEILALPNKSLRRILRSYSALGDFVAGGSTQGIGQEPAAPYSSQTVP
ncbi:hypothetical protein CCYA_CCYA17G4439 [Cyanidiococcus yangmingshanensis]|nr:hypothetical protein CCYA_CCYA17G4439 [Cyanidiococcus yangmingshanensis]